MDRVDGAESGASDPARELARMMEREAEALRRADFAALSGLAEAKAALVERVAVGEGARPESLRHLAAVARRNGAILKAAIGGVRAARLRVDELRRAAAGLETYDRAGRKTAHNGAGGRMERRA